MKKFWVVLFVVMLSITGVFAGGQFEQSAAASTQSAADRAVEAAKKYSGITLNVFYEAGLQPLDPKKFTGPMWEKLTGIKIKL